MKRKKSVEAWLRTTAKKSASGCLAASCGFGAAAAVVLFISFWIIYVISLFFSLSLSHEVRLCISLIGVCLLFVGLLADRRELESYSFTTGTFHKKPVSVPLPGGRRGSTINPLAPDSAHSMIKMIASIVTFGPTLTAEAWRMLRRSWRFKNLDIDGCAAVLEVLARADQRVPMEEVVEAIPDGHDVAQVLTQLQLFDQVMLLLNSQPVGMSLDPEFRSTLRKLMKRRESDASEPPA
jgi:hypothetical protein